MADLAELTIVINTKGAEEANKLLNNITKAGEAAERSVSKNLNKAFSTFNTPNLGKGVQSEIDKMLKAYKDLYANIERISGSGLLGKSGQNWLAKQKADLAEFPKYFKTLVKDMGKAMSAGFIDDKTLTKYFSNMTAGFEKSGKSALKVLDEIEKARLGKGGLRGAALTSVGASVGSGISSTKVAGDALREYAEAKKQLKKFNDETRQMHADMGEQRNEFLNRDSAAIKRHYEEQLALREKHDDELSRRDAEMAKRAERHLSDSQKKENRIRETLLDEQMRSINNKSDQDWQRQVARENEAKKRELKYAKDRADAFRNINRYGSTTETEAIYGKTKIEGGQSWANAKKEAIALTKTQTDLEKLAEEKYKRQKAELDKIDNIKKKINNTATATVNTTKDWATGLAKGLGVYLSLYGAGLLLRRAFEAWVGLIREALEQIDDLRTQIIEASAMMTSLSDSWKPTEEVYAAWDEYFNWLYRQSLAADRKFAASGKEIFKVAQESAYRGVIATTTEQVETLAKLTDTIKIVTKGIGHQEWQIYQEIRNLFLGSEARLMGAQLLQRFKQIDPNVQQTIARLQQLRAATGDMGPLFSYINKLMSGMNIGSEKMAKTWGSLVSTVKGAFQLLMNEAFGPAYEQIVSIGWQLLDIVYKNGQLTASGQVLAKVLSSAWSEISSRLQAFANDLEANPEKIKIWADMFVKFITKITIAFFELAKIILKVIERIDELSKIKLFSVDEKDSPFVNIKEKTSNPFSMGKEENPFSIKYVKKRLSEMFGYAKEGETEQTNDIKKEYEEFINTLGNFDKKKLPPVWGMNIDEKEILSALNKFQKAYLDFSKTITDSFGSIWGKIFDYQAQSLETIRDIGSEMFKATGIGEKALKYEQDLLAIRKEALNVLLEEKKLEYKEYWVSLLPPLQAAREKTKIDEEKEKRKYELPPAAKQFNVFLDFVALFNKSLINFGDTSIAARENIINGCIQGGESLVNKSKESAKILQEALNPPKPKTTTKEVFTPMGVMKSTIISDLVAAAEQMAYKYSIDPAIFKALIKNESGWNPRATSPKGAMGLTQLMPGTAKDLGVADPYDIMQNLEGGAKYLAEMLKRFNYEYEKALAAYNAGAGRVEKAGGIPQITETQNYVKKVLADAKSMQTEASFTPGSEMLREFYFMVFKLVSDSIKASNCGDAVALAINTGLTGKKLPRGGLDESTVREYAKLYNAPVLNRNQITMENLNKLGPGTIIWMKRDPSDPNYTRYGKDHAEVTAANYMNELSRMTWSKERGAELKQLDENYLKRLPEHTIATNFFSKNRLPSVTTEGETFDRTRGQMEKEIAEIREKIKEFKQPYAPDIEAGQIQRRLENEISADTKKNEMRKQYNELLAQTLEGTGEEWKIKEDLIRIETNTNLLALQRNEYRDEELQAGKKLLQDQYVLIEAEKLRNLQLDKANQSLEKSNVIYQKVADVYSSLGSISSEYLNVEGSKNVAGYKLKSSEIQIAMDRNKLEQELISLRKQHYSEDTIAQVKRLGELKLQTEEIKAQMEYQKEMLQYGGAKEGLQLWALNRMPEVNKRRTSNIADLMGELESGFTDIIGNGIMAAVKGTGAQALEELGMQLLETVTQRMISMTVQSLFDWLAQMIYGTTTLFTMSSTAAATLTQGGVAAGNAMVQAAIASAKILAQAGSSESASSGFTGILKGLYKGGDSGWGYAPNVQSTGFGLIDSMLGGMSMKYHSGGLIYAHGGLNLASDEVPIIAQTGERILSRQQNAEYEAGMNKSTEINITIQNNTKVPIEASSKRTSEKDFLIMLDEANAALMNNGGKMAKAMEQRFSLSQKIVRR